MLAIITPLYNDPKGIAKAIKSIENQMDMVEYIHIIVDDGSTDNSREVVKNINSQNVILLTNLENSGPSASRNLAIKYAFDNYNMDYFAFIDSDDIWYSKHIKNAIDILDGIDTFEEFDFYCSVPIFEDENHNTKYPYGINPNKELSYDNLLNGNSIYISSVVVRANVIKTIGYFDSYTDGLEDWDYWLRIAKYGFTMYLDKNQTIKYLVKNDGMAKNGKNAKYVVLSKYKNLKLNLGCGDEILEGYVNCDLYGDKADMIFDAATIPFPDNSINEIRAYHLIEHFNFMEGLQVLKEWFRVLKPEGKLVLETPDLLNTCDQFVKSTENERIILYGHFFAWPWIPGQAHYFLYTESQMNWSLEEIGFKNIKRVKPDSIYALANPQWENLYLKIEAIK